MFLYRAAHWPVAVDETFPMRVNKRFKRPMDQQLFSRAAVKGIFARQFPEPLGIIVLPEAPFVCSVLEK